MAQYGLYVLKMPLNHNKLSSCWSHVLRIQPSGLYQSTAGGVLVRTCVMLEKPVYSCTKLHSIHGGLTKQSSPKSSVIYLLISCQFLVASSTCCNGVLSV